MSHIAAAVVHNLVGSDIDPADIAGNSERASGLAVTVVAVACKADIAGFFPWRAALRKALPKGRRYRCKKDLASGCPTYRKMRIDRHFSWAHPSGCPLERRRPYFPCFPDRRCRHF